MVHYCLYKIKKRIKLYNRNTNSSKIAKLWHMKLVIP
jgi:hypothetical protein